MSARARRDRSLTPLVAVLVAVPAIVLVAIAVVHAVTLHLQRIP